MALPVFFTTRTGKLVVIASIAAAAAAAVILTVLLSVLLTLPSDDCTSLTLTPLPSCCSACSSYCGRGDDDGCGGSLVDRNSFH
jgi:hypothetical protein